MSASLLRSAARAALLVTAVVSSIATSSTSTQTPDWTTVSLEAYPANLQASAAGTSSITFSFGVENTRVDDLLTTEATLHLDALPATAGQAGAFEFSVPGSDLYATPTSLSSSSAYSLDVSDLVTPAALQACTTSISYGPGYCTVEVTVQIDGLGVPVDVSFVPEFGGTGLGAPDPLFLVLDY